MPIASGFVVPEMKPISNVGGIRLLRLVVVAVENYPYCPLSFFGEYQPLEAGRLLGGCAAVSRHHLAVMQLMVGVVVIAHIFTDLGGFPHYCVFIQRDVVVITYRFS